MIRLSGLIDLKSIGLASVTMRSVNEEELSGKQHKLDVDKDGKIEADDLAKLRKQTDETLDEEEYDTQRDARDMRRLFGSDDDDDYSRELPDRPSRFPKRSSSRRPQTPLPAQRPVAAQQSTQTRETLLQQKVKYQDADGKSHEATVKSLLGYAKEHPGRKIAARMYAQHMAKTKKNINEQDGVNPHPSNDHEVSMANNSLDSIIQYANELKTKVGQEEKDIPAWIQDHISNAANYISQAANNYHEYNMPDKPQPDNSQNTQSISERVKFKRK